MDTSQKDEIIIKGSKEFEDERGKISNYELSESINWVGLISSKAGAIRANHYHPEQEQKILVVSGSYISIYKDLSDPNNSIKDHLVQAGDLVITPPNVAHVMIFLEDSIIINLVNGDREHDKFKQHTVPYNVINIKNPEELERYTSKYRYSFRVGGRAIEWVDKPTEQNEEKHE